ncbi:MAG: hypothetical protein HYV26_12770 [Candidatus Hydrogenedentes bacterium]|nr:hypothetical protein [Candidatus Hydrogenedentota bacterium]
MSLSADELRSIYRKTVIVRKPTYGIISGYHELPYVCLGTAIEPGYSATRVKGKIQVSPRFVIRPSQYLPKYEEIFGENNVDVELNGRIFGFLGFPNRPVECTSERLELRHLHESVDHALSESLDELERREDITTGVFITPNSRYYPVSVERFIASILEDEFST